MQVNGSMRWIGLASLALGLAMIIVDATIVNVAIPSIIADLGLQLTDAEWINSVYSLVFAALLVTVGRLGDLFGRKRVYLIGLGLFVLASLLCAIAPSGGLLIAARAAQGIGAAFILPSTLSSVNAMFRGRERAIAFGIWGSVIGGVAALGPLVGGWLTTDFSWRWAFGINLPLGLLAGTVALLTVPETRDPHTQRGLDLLGIVSSALGFGALVFGLIEGERYGWWHPTDTFRIGSWEWPLRTLSPVPIALAIAALVLPAFAWYELRRIRRGQPVLLDLRLFRYPSFRWGNLAALIVSLGEFGIVFVLPLYLQAVLGYTALQTGFVLLATAIGAFLGGPAAANLAQRFGARQVVRAGMILEASGLLLIVPFLSPTTTGWRLAPALFLYGLGVGLATAQLTSVILAEVPTAQSGQASGTQSTTRQVGAALGIALLGAVLAAGLSSGTEARLRDLGLPAEQAVAIARATKQSAGQILVELRQQPGTTAVVEAIERAFTTAARRTAIVAAAFIAIGFVASTLLPDIRPGRTEEPAVGAAAAREADER
ncbi:MAG: MFS transporter [Thermomicrobium sp.]|nr:MFS transporter [Thermomicrobium sp.]MDW8059633.1 MFS transporter [Thermomicrobium sp.]